MSSPASSAESAKAQIEGLRKKLLDLSLRNRMLNYKPSKRLGVAVVGEDCTVVHQLLVEEGKKLSFVGRPDPANRAIEPDTLFDGDDEVAMTVHREAAVAELDTYLANTATPVDQRDTKLNTEETVSILQAKLRTLARESGIANEELGINTLFMTLGMLEWAELDERVLRAPLIFVPVRLEKQANGSVKLLYDGSDVGTNLPLRAKLSELNLRLPDLDEDKSLTEYFKEVETTIRSRSNWQVLRNEICLGFFNYEKYAMYVDLGGENWPDDRKPWTNTDLVAMLGGGYPAVDSTVDDRTQLDTVRAVATCREVYDADSSQTLAMIRAADGVSIVVEGPPGTGKSQTITNIIAEAVAAGKTVLFVSAKRAALDVVRRNLERAELSAMCLDLHDKLTNRREFYAEIKRTVSKSLSVRHEEEKVHRLSELRDKLNAHSAAVNEPLKEFETTPFAAMALLARLPVEQADDRDGRIPFPAIRHWKDSDVKVRLPLVSALQQRLQSIGIPANHPFWGAELDYLDPAIRLDLEQDLAAGLLTLDKATTAATCAAEAFHINLKLSGENVRVLRECAKQALSAPPHQNVPVKTAVWKHEEPVVRRVIESLEVRNELRNKRQAQVQESIWAADLSQVSAALELHADQWYAFLYGAYRNANRSLAGLLSQNAPTDAPARRDLVRDVLRSQAAEAHILSQSEAMSRLLGAQWRGLDTDPVAIAGLLKWVLDLHTSVASGDLPSGLVDFFSGAPTNQDLLKLVEDAESASDAWLQAFQKVSGQLAYTQPDLTDELWTTLGDRLQSWQANLPSLPAFIAFNEARRQCLEQGLAPVIAVADQWPLAAERLSDTFLRSYYSGVVREAMMSRPELKTFERGGHEASIAEFQSLDDFKLKYNRAQVRLEHQKLLPTFDHAVGNLALLKVQCELQRSHKPIRWIMARAGEAIQRIKPVFMMSPLSVAIHLPPELPPFDMVVFDEASQIKPEDALSSVVRAKQTIVVGDTRQMPPTSFFDRLADDDEIEDEDEATFGREAAKLESVLSLMSAVTMGQKRRPDLRWHYRSIHPSLIQPSNEMFYDNRLIVFPSPSLLEGGKRIGIVFHHLPETVYEAGSRKRINRKEAEAVADHVLRHVTHHPEESLLVAAMNKTQADLIDAEVQIRERLHPDAFQQYRDKHPFEALAVKNLESVQGDERDVIYISVTYGRDASGVIRQQFGPLLLDGGERRLNVLITRARRRCEVFSNMTADDIRLERPGSGVAALKRYLQFAQTGSTSVAVPTGREEESPFEEEVTAALSSRGFTVDTQVGSEGYRIDIGVIDPEKPGRYVLGIECDGATYHSARSARDRDKLRQRVLESRGWKLHRIWSHDWWQDRDGEIERMVQAIQESLADVMPDALDDEEEPVLVNEAPRAAAIGKTRPYTAAQPVVGEDLEVYMLRVVEIEGPIHRDLLRLRLRDAAGYARAGANVRASLDGLIERNASKVHVAGDSYYADAGQIATPRDWSDRPAQERKAEFVPEVEVATALDVIVGDAFGISESDAVRAAYNLMGFRRVTDGVAALGVPVVARLVAEGVITRREDGLLFGAG